jgi:dipeptide/tripeptide permease
LLFGFNIRLVFILPYLSHFFTAFWSVVFTQLFSIEFCYHFFYFSSVICLLIAFYALVMCLSVFRDRRMKQNKSGQKKCKKNQNIRGYRGINTGTRVKQHGPCWKASGKRKTAQVSGSTRAPVLINTARVEKQGERSKTTQDSGSTRAPVFINTARVEWPGAFLLI